MAFSIYLRALKDAVAKELILCPKIYLETKNNTDMTTSNIEIQSRIDYICSHCSFIFLDKNDFESVCPNPSFCIDKKCETLEETLDAVKSALASSPLTYPSKVVIYAESRILTMADLAVFKDYFQSFNAYKFGFNCEAPEGAKVRIVLIG